MVEKTDIDTLQVRLDEAHEYMHIDEKQTELKKLDEEQTKPGFWDDAQKASEVTQRASALRSLLERYDETKTLLEDTYVAYDLAADDPEFASDVEANVKIITEALDRFEMESWFSGRFDEGDAIVTINPGSGGLEAQDWTEMLFKMYVKFAEREGWDVQLLDVVPGDETVGLDHASFQVKGRLAYGMLRSEMGVHRLVRISPTDIKQRRHTTFASVEVMPVIPDEIEVTINPADLRIDVYRSSGPGGQSVNTTDSAVRITHIPTGIVVTCQNEKSQLHNKEAAMRVLRAKLYERAEAQRQEELDDLRGERMDNSFGSQIRNYVLYPYQLVKDVRSGVETSNVDAVLAGDIEQFVIGYHKWRS